MSGTRVAPLTRVTFTMASLSASVLAFISTIHVAMAVLRAHRSPTTGVLGFVTPISLLLAGSPWLMSSPVGVAVGLLTHVGWFTACERLLPVPAAPRQAAAVAAVAPPPRPTRPIVPKPVVRPAAAASAASKPHDFVRVPVMAVFNETRDIRTFRMARPDDFEFKAGQFLTLRVRADGRDYVRCYSISSPPGARGHMEISVKRLGVVSGALHATVRPGTMLSVRPPAGAFTYPAGEERPIVMLAGGVGITPLMAMIRHGLDTEPMRPMTLFYSVRTQADIAFFDEIRLLDRRHAQFRAFMVISDGPATGEFIPGLISGALVTRTVPDVADATCLVCGPPPMLDAMTTMLLGLGVPRQQIHFEVFNPAIAVSAGAPPRIEVATPVADTSFEITFARSQRSVTVGADQTLLEAAEGCDAPIPSLCRAGVCGTCRTRVVSGQADCRSSTLDEQDRLDGYVLPCVTRVVSDCTVDA